MTQLAHRIEAKRDRLCDLLRELVCVPTVNPPGEHYAEMAELLRAKCDALGMTTAIHSVPEEEAAQFIPTPAEHPRFNLVGRWDVGAAKTVHFNAHYDVVPVGDDWTVDPFAGTVEGEWFYARGADDMKDSIAALLVAIETIQEAGVTPAFNIECSFTADEETGGDLGAGYLARHGLIRADYVVNCEGGTEQNVGVGHNGVLWFHVTVHGKAAHASRPDNGLNAVEKMAELIVALQGLKETFQKPERLFLTPSGAERRPTINIGGIFFGTPGDKENTIPARATFSIDRRILPNESVASAEAELRAAIDAAVASIPDLHVTIERKLAIEPCEVRVEDPFVQAFGRAVTAVRGEPARFSLTTGFTDLHFLLEDGKRVGVGYGPKGERGHGADERVRIGDLVTTATIYAEFLAHATF